MAECHRTVRYQNCDTFQCSSSNTQELKYLVDALTMPRINLIKMNLETTFDVEKKTKTVKLKVKIEIYNQTSKCVCK